MIGRAWLVTLLLLVPHAARAAEVKRVVIRVPDPTSRALLQRIRGQTSDLALDLVETAEPLEPRVGEEVARAGLLARERSAQVVLWFEEGPSGLVLFFCLPAEERTLVRTLPEDGPEHGGPPSATFEAAALIVRSVLRALASGGTIGVTLAAPLDVSERAVPPAGPLPVVAPPANAASERNESAPPAPSVPEAPKTPRAAGWGLSGSAGWHAALVAPSVLLQGGEGRAQITHGDFAGGLQCAVDAPGTLVDPDATVTLLRIAAGGFVAYAPALDVHWHLFFALGGGAVGFRRETTSVAAKVTRAPDAWDTSGLVGPELGVSYRRRGAGLWWGIGARVGADIVLTPPVIGNVVAGAFVTEHALWNVEPKGVIELELGGP